MESKTKKILIVEDEKDIGDLLSYHLKKEFFPVKQVKSAEEALLWLEEEKPLLIILDIMLPKMSGLEFCNKIKSNPKTKDIAVLILTAKSAKEDIVRGLQLGADDYVTKPFDISEIVARIKAILRRTSSRTVTEQEFKYASLRIHWARHKIYMNKKEIKLTLTEFKILKALIENHGRVLTRDRLLDEVTGGETVVIDRTIDVHIQSLRKKLGGGDTYIETIRGIGYRFRDE